MEMFWRIILLMLALAEGARSANILALMAVPSHSHHLWHTKYLEALVKRGHRVTYFSPDEYKNRPENVTQILIKGVYDLMDEDIDLIASSESGPYGNILLLREWDDLIGEFYVKNEAIRELTRLIRKEKFDLIVHDIGACLFLLGAVDVLGRTPAVGITPFGVPPWTLEILGNPSAYSSKPHFYASHSNDMTLLQRADNYFLHLFCFGVRWFYKKNQNELAKKGFGNDIRPLEQILDDINIIMVNSNDGIDFPFPKVPGLIPVGGLHISEPKPLPQELKTFLDEADHGAVYFSLGTNIKSSLTKEKIEILMKAFREIAPVRVLWKLEADSLPPKPENVKIQKWLPQNDILAHPNVRVFFTHSGMLSTQESIYHGKPIVGMPFFLDQKSNLEKCMARGFGEKLDYKTLTVEETVSTIRKVLNEPRYLENVRKASAIFRDGLEKPLDRAVYWTEYAIRHKGAPHLRHSARNLSWFENAMLDVVLLSSAFVLFIMFIAYKLVNTVISAICSNNIKLKNN